MTVTDLSTAIDAAARGEGLSGAIRVDVAGETIVRAGYGMAHRALGVPNTPETRFGLASGLKGLTALAVVSLVEEGTLSLDTTARSLLGTDLPLIDDDVTVEHLLAHRSGIGDYLDEDAGGAITDYLFTVPSHQLDSAEAYLAVLDGFPTAFPPGERFAYNNGGYVVLALLAERASGTPYADLVTERVCRPAGMASTAFLRSDELPGDAALGYLGPDFGDRTNLLHLPVVGVGDGGIYSTVDDIHRFWQALFAGAIVPARWVDEMVRPRSKASDAGYEYGLGFWLHESSTRVQLEGYDSGVSFRTVHDPVSDLTWTVVANTSEGAWPVTKRLATLLTS